MFCSLKDEFDKAYCVLVHEFSSAAYAVPKTH